MQCGAPQASSSGWDAGGARPRYVKHLLQRLQTSYSHVLFFVVDTAGCATLAVVGTDVRFSGHFMYSSMPDFKDAPPLRCTNRQKVMDWLAALGATDAAPPEGVAVPTLSPHQLALLMNSDPLYARPKLDREYNSWREERGRLPDGRHFKHYHLVDDASGAELLVIAAEDSHRKDRRYNYKALPEVGGFTFENGASVKEWLDFVVGKAGAGPGHSATGGAPGVGVRRQRTPDSRVVGGPAAARRRTQTDQYAQYGQYMDADNCGALTAGGQYLMQLTGGTTRTPPAHLTCTSGARSEATHLTMAAPPPPSLAYPPQHQQHHQQHHHQHSQDAWQHLPQVTGQGPFAPLPAGLAAEEDEMGADDGFPWILDDSWGMEPSQPAAGGNDLLAAAAAETAGGADEHSQWHYQLLASLSPRDYCLSPLAVEQQRQHQLQHQQHHFQPSQQPQPGPSAFCSGSGKAGRVAATSSGTSAGAMVPLPRTPPPPHSQQLAGCASPLWLSQEDAQQAVGLPWCPAAGSHPACAGPSGSDLELVCSGPASSFEAACDAAAAAAAAAEASGTSHHTVVLRTQTDGGSVGPAPPPHPWPPQNSQAQQTLHAQQHGWHALTGADVHAAFQGTDELYHWVTGHAEEAATRQLQAWAGQLGLLTLGTPRAAPSSEDGRATVRAAGEAAEGIVAPPVSSSAGRAADGGGANGLDTAAGGGLALSNAVQGTGHPPPAGVPPPPAFHTADLPASTPAAAAAKAVVGARPAAMCSQASGAMASWPSGQPGTPSVASVPGALDFEAEALHRWAAGCRTGAPSTSSAGPSGGDASGQPGAATGGDGGGEAGGRAAMAALDILTALEHYCMNLRLLEASQIIGPVTRLRRHRDHCVAGLAGRVARKWRASAAATLGHANAVMMKSTATCKGMAGGMHVCVM